MKKIKVRALKRLTFYENGEISFVEIGEYTQIDDKLLQKFLRLKAVEIVEQETETLSELPLTEEKSDDTELPPTEEKPDIVTIIEVMDAIRKKSELVEYGESLGVDGLNTTMSMEDIKTAIINALEEAE